MGLNCILTDSAAQFTRKSLINNNDIQVLPYYLDQGTGKVNINQVNILELPDWNPPGNLPTLLPPAENSLVPTLYDIQRRYDDVFIITTSAELFPAYKIIENIIAKQHGRARVHLIDSQTISIGEGIIVQKTMELIQRNILGDEIEEQLRQVIPHIFTLMCTPNFSYLHKYGFLDAGQSVAGEMQSLFPIFSLERGQLTPLDKFKNTRNIIDYYIEFIDEFDKIESVAIIQPTSPLSGETRIVRQYIEEHHPETTFTESHINPFLAALIGPGGMGIVVHENVN